MRNLSDIRRRSLSTRNVKTVNEKTPTCHNMWATTTPPTPFCFCFFVWVPFFVFEKTSNKNQGPFLCLGSNFPFFRPPLAARVTHRRCTRFALQRWEPAACVSFVRHSLSQWFAARQSWGTNKHRTHASLSLKFTNCCEFNQASISWQSLVSLCVRKSIGMA